MSAKHRAHRFDLKMTADKNRLEQFVNSLDGEILVIIPNVSNGLFWAHRVDFVLVAAKLA